MLPDDNIKNKFTRLKDIIGFLYEIKEEDFVGYTLPSHHEAVVYRAIVEMCNGLSNIDDCWIILNWLEEDIDLADDDGFWGCISGGSEGYYQENGFSTASDADDNCNVIGRNGLSKDAAFRSLLAGSRWPDLKGMPAMMADNQPDFLYEKNAHNNPKGQAARSSAAHLYMSGAVDTNFDLRKDWALYDANNDGIVDYADYAAILDNDSLKIATSKDGELYLKLNGDKNAWEPDPNGDGEKVDTALQWITRQQAYLTATASFIVDRFLQAQPAIAPDSPYHISQYYKLEQDLGFFWELPCLVAATQLEIRDIAVCATLCSPLFNPLFPIESAILVAQCVAICQLMPDAGDCMLAVSLESLFDQGRNNPNSAINACLAPLIFSKLYQPNFGSDIAWFKICQDYTKENNRDGESLLVSQAPFFAGQAIHAIADSFAHTIRNKYVSPILGIESPIVQIRRSGGEIEGKNDTDRNVWSMAHSICYDHDCKFGGDNINDAWRFSSYADARIYGDDNEFGDENRENSVHAIADFLRTFSASKFEHRWNHLKAFVNKWLVMAIPEEMILKQGEEIYAAPYNLNGRLCNERDPYPGVHPSLEDPPDGYPGGHNIDFPTKNSCSEGTYCDQYSGICRKGGCQSNSDCRFDGSYCGGDGFCYMKWNPWDLVADQSFLKMGENPATSRYHSHTQHQSAYRTFKNVSEHRILDARHWYFIERHEKDNSGNDADIKARLLKSIESCEQSSVILFSLPGYNGNYTCADKTYFGQMEVSDVRSFYVKEHRKVCFIRNSKNDDGKDEEMCFYGGINGTAENFLMPPWGTHKRLNEKSNAAIKAVRWSMADVDEDGVPDADDNCIFFYNPDQADMDNDSMGDACDPDKDGDNVLEDNGGPGAWNRGDIFVINPCRGRFGSDLSRCDDNCPNVYNPDQGNCDEDDFGDLCDYVPFIIECPKNIVTSECENVDLGRPKILDDDCAALVSDEDVSNNAPVWYDLGETAISWMIKNPSGVYSQCTQTVTRIVAADFFVDDNALGANDGSSWEDAFSSLQSALNLAEPGDVIWVKEGSYSDGPYPLKTGVDIYGSFNQSLTDTCGGEHKRNIRNDKSIINGNNAGVCLVSARDGHMDGFTVQYCNGTNGGAIQITDPNIVFGNMLFQNNQSPNGGVINNESYTTFYNCEFLNNTSSNGGAIRNAGEISCKNCVFKNNYGSNGGAVAFGYGTFIDSLFEDNSSNNGGAMNNVAGDFQNCRFISNHSYNGGALTGVGGSFFDCLFMYNSAINGGAVEQSQGVFVNCEFSYNNADTNGGAVADSSGTFVNCIVANNNSNINGGGVSGGNTDFTNCTIADNTAGISGGGISGNANINNSIVWGNRAGTWADHINGWAQVNYSAIEGGWNGTQNITNDPMFDVTIRSDYELQAGSPCIDAAYAVLSPLKDIFGTERSAPDIGAVEYLKITWECGNGKWEIGESCDDGNTIDGDGCSSTCEKEPSCSDFAQNQDETDMNCGGWVCDKCVDGKNCFVHRDCLSGYCNAGICAGPIPSCNDDEINGTETDLNCGGNSCPPCEEGKQCHINTDCISENCDSGICQEAIPDLCTIASAIDLGAPGNWVTVPNNGCVKVQNEYPDWWDARIMQLQPDQGTYPVPFDWTNICSESSGNATFNNNWDNRFIGPVSEDCATLILLHGSGAGNITLRYYGL